MFVQRSFWLSTHCGIFWLTPFMKNEQVKIINKRADTCIYLYTYREFSQALFTLGFITTLHNEFYYPYFIDEEKAQRGEVLGWGQRANKGSLWALTEAFWLHISCLLYYPALGLEHTGWGSCILMVGSKEGVSGITCLKIWSLPRGRICKERKSGKIRPRSEFVHQG